jgi:hypothetical protein
VIWIAVVVLSVAALIIYGCRSRPETRLERYALGVPIELRIGEPGPLKASRVPAIPFRASRLMCSALCRDFVYLQSLRFAGVEVLAGHRTDASVLSSGCDLADIPIVGPDHGDVSFSADYTGLVPPGFKKGDTFLFSVCVTGNSAGPHIVRVSNWTRAIRACRRSYWRWRLHRPVRDQLEADR